MKENPQEDKWELTYGLCNFSRSPSLHSRDPMTQELSPPSWRQAHLQGKWLHLRVTCEENSK